VTVVTRDAGADFLLIGSCFVIINVFFSASAIQSGLY